jgi:hypothetical protein
MRTRIELLHYLASLIEVGNFLDCGKDFCSDYGRRLIQEEIELIVLEMRELWYLSKTEWIN